jgi:hypothetical protein
VQRTQRNVKQVFAPPTATDATSPATATKCTCHRIAVAIVVAVAIAVDVAAAAITANVVAAASERGCRSLVKPLI